MRRLLIAFLTTLTGCSAGCNRHAAPPAQPSRPNAAQGAEVIRTSTINGFDDDGDPEIREMSDGSIKVVFNYMPPSWVPEDQYTATDLGPFRDFDMRMEKAIGVQVLWDDREFFVIRQPKADTIEKIKQFLASVRPKQVKSK